MKMIKPFLDAIDWLMDKVSSTIEGLIKQLVRVIPGGEKYKDLIADIFTADYQGFLLDILGLETGGDCKSRQIEEWDPWIHFGDYLLVAATFLTMVNTLFWVTGITGGPVACLIFSIILTTLAWLLRYYNPSDKILNLYGSLTLAAAGLMLSIRGAITCGKEPIEIVLSAVSIGIAAGTVYYVTIGIWDFYGHVPTDAEILGWL
jgi:hypothetical protein